MQDQAMVKDGGGAKVRAEVSWAGSSHRSWLSSSRYPGINHQSWEGRGHESPRKTQDTCVAWSFLNLASHFMSGETEAREALQGLSLVQQVGDRRATRV